MTRMDLSCHPLLTRVMLGASEESHALGYEILRFTQDDTPGSLRMTPSKDEVAFATLDKRQGSVLLME